MPIKQNLSELLHGEVKSKEIIDIIFNDLENQLLDKTEVVVDLKEVSFISVYFLERLEKFVGKANELSVKIEIKNVSPYIYKVFQVGRLKAVLSVCT